MQKHNESENKFTYSVPTFNRFNTLRDENPDFQRKHTLQKLKKSTGTSVTNEKSGRAADSNNNSRTPYQMIILGNSHFKRLYIPYNHFVNNCEVMKRSTYDIKEATEVISNMSSLKRGIQCVVIQSFTKDIQSKSTDDYIRALDKLFDNILEIWLDCHIVISTALFRRSDKKLTIQYMQHK
jgi:hypothetical protein